MTPQEARAYIGSISLSWALFIFGGLFVLAAISNGTYIVEAFTTFLYGTISVYLEQIEEYQQSTPFVWTRRALLVLWVLIVASRYLSLFQPLNLWAH